MPAHVAPPAVPAARIRVTLPHMLALESAYGVTRVHLWSRLGRAVGYTVSAYLTRGVLVDTGFPRAAAEVRALLAHERPRAVVVTHAHEDHGGNAALVAAAGIPVVASAATLAALRAPEALPYYRRAVWGLPAALPAGSGVEEHPALEAAGLCRLAAAGHAADHSVVWDEERGHLTWVRRWLDSRPDAEALLARYAAVDERVYNEFLEYYGWSDA